MTCTNCVLDRSDKNCPILTEIDLVELATYIWMKKLNDKSGGIEITDKLREQNLTCSRDQVIDWGE